MESKRKTMPYIKITSSDRDMFAALLSRYSQKFISKQTGYPATMVHRALTMPQKSIDADLLAKLKELYNSDIQQHRTKLEFADFVKVDPNIMYQLKGKLNITGISKLLGMKYSTVYEMFRVDEFWVSPDNKIKVESEVGNEACISE